MQYIDKAFEKIDKSCPVAAQIGLGHIVDAIYDALQKGTSYEGDSLTEDQVKLLDKMCSASDITDIAYILNDILKAAKGEGTVYDIDTNTIKKINHGICGIFEQCKLGDKLQEMIIKINGGSVTPDVSKVISARDGSLQTYNKKVSDLQEDIVVSANGKLTGILKYVTDYECGADTEGNYIALHIDSTQLPSGTISVGFAPSTWADIDTNDCNINIKVNKDNRQNIGLSIRVDGRILYTLDLTGLTLQPKE